MEIESDIHIDLQKGWQIYRWTISYTDKITYYRQIDRQIDRLVEGKTSRHICGSDVAHMHVVVIMLYNLQLTPVHQIYIQSSIQETKQYEKGTLILAHTGAAEGVNSFWFVSDRVPEKWNFSEINVKYFDLNMSRSGDYGYASGSKKFFLTWSCVFVILINKKNIGLVSFDSWEVHGLCVWVHAFSDKGRTSRVACVHVAGNKSLSGCKLKRAGQIGHCPCEMVSYKRYPQKKYY